MGVKKLGGGKKEKESRISPPCQIRQGFACDPMSLKGFVCSCCGGSVQTRSSVLHLGEGSY